MIKPAPSGRHFVLPFLLLLCLLMAAGPPAAGLPADSLAGARAAVLQEADSGKVLFSYRGDSPLAPASLTKLVTLHLVYNRIASGSLEADRVIAVPPQASWRRLEAGSSLMFIEQGQRVTVGELMRGVAVSSGNDAALALACVVAGDAPSFVRLMNREVRGLGYSTLCFVDPSGLSADNSVTAREFAAFCRDYIRLHPESLADLHARKSFTYPLPANLPARAGGAGGTGDAPGGIWPDPGARPPAIRQNNRNLLLWEYPGLDGLKTGYIDEAGYNIAATARRGGMRLIAVVLGIQAPDHVQGGRLRADAAAALLDYGFASFVTLRPDPPPLDRPRVWKGKQRTVEPVPARELVLTMSRRLLAEPLRFETRLKDRLIAPVRTGQVVGELRVLAGEQLLERFTLLAAGRVERGGFARRLWDGLRLGLDSLLRRLRGGRPGA
jgi:D-alanyl-D-alanine carboxypeptidase (penicillin-binding protein 5/6)